MRTNISTSLAYAVSAFALILAACGGSGDDGAGALTDFSVSPTKVDVTWLGTTCPLTPQKVGDFLVIGGTAPYTLFSSFVPDPGSPNSSITMSVPVVNTRNTQFAAFVAGCFDPGTITILDKQGRTATVALTSKPASAP